MLNLEQKSKAYQKIYNVILYIIITAYLVAGYLPQIFQFTLGVIPICLSLTYGFLATIYAIRLLATSPPLPEFSTYNHITKRFYQLLKTFFGIFTFFISGLYGWYVGKMFDSIKVESIEDIVYFQNALLDVVRTILQYCMAFLLLWIVCLSIGLFRLSRKYQHSGSLVFHHGKHAYTSEAVSDNTILQFLLHVYRKTMRYYINNPGWFSLAFGITLTSAMTFGFNQLDMYLSTQIRATL